MNTKPEHSLTNIWQKFPRKGKILKMNGLSCPTFDTSEICCQGNNKHKILPKKLKNARKELDGLLLSVCSMTELSRSCLSFEDMSNYVGWVCMMQKYPRARCASCLCEIALTLLGMMYTRFWSYSTHYFT